MRKILISVIVFLSLSLLNTCVPPAAPESKPGLKDAIIFSLPASMTGSTASKGAETREISSGTIAVVNSFFKAVRDRILFADFISQLVKS